MTLRIFFTNVYFFMIVLSSSVLNSNCTNPDKEIKQQLKKVFAEMPGASVVDTSNALTEEGKALFIKTRTLLSSVTEDSSPLSDEKLTLVVESIDNLGRSLEAKTVFKQRNSDADDINKDREFDACIMQCEIREAGSKNRCTGLKGEALRNCLLENRPFDTIECILKCGRFGQMTP